MKSHGLPGYNCTLKICLTPPIGKIGFPLKIDFCLRVSATVIALPKSPKGCFVLIVGLFFFF